MHSQIILTIATLFVPYFPTSTPIQVPEIGYTRPKIIKPLPALPPPPQSYYEALAYVPPVVVHTTPTPQPVTAPQNNIGQGGGGYSTSPDEDKAFIYAHESGNNPHAHNPGGCRGLGQACPGSKLPCGDDDYACQDEWFTGYMQARYGSWANARAYWVAHSSW